MRTTTRPAQRWIAYLLGLALVVTACSAPDAVSPPTGPASPVAQDPVVSASVPAPGSPPGVAPTAAPASSARLSAPTPGPGAPTEAPGSAAPPSSTPRPGASPAADATTGAGALYLGPLPAPAPLSPPPAATPPNQAWSDWTREVQALADAARGGGPDAVAAWQTLLVRSGIPVLDDAGSPIAVDGTTGAGYAVTSGELRLLAALAATPGGMTVAELADVLAGIPGLDADELSRLLAEALLTYDGAGPEVATWRAAYSAFDNGSTWGAFLRGELGSELTADAIRLSWGQVGLLLRRLASEALLRAAADQLGRGGGPSSTGLRGGTSPITLAAATPITAASVAEPCTFDSEIADLLLNVAIKARDYVFGSVLDRMLERAELAAADEAVDLPPSLQKTQKILKAIGIAQTVAAYLSLAARFAALRARFEVQQAPLRRTKNQRPGEVKDLRIEMFVDKSALDPIVRCLKLALSMGNLTIDLPYAEGGPQAGIEVDLFSDDRSTLLVGDATGGGRPATNASTGADGVAAFKLSGAPQRQKIPERARPVDIKVGLRAVTNLEGSDLKRDLIDLPFDAATGPIGAVIQKLLARTKWITFHGSVPVVDWDIEAEFIATLSGYQSEHSASRIKVTPVKPCPGGTFSSSTDQELTVRSERVHVDAVLFDNPQGNWGDQVVLLIPHGSTVDAFLWQEPSDFLGTAPVLFSLPSSVRVERRGASPGTGELPPVKTETGVGCGGGGEGKPPKPDCGARTYRAEIGIVVPRPRELFPWMDFPPDGLYDLYRNCAGQDPVPGEFADQTYWGSELRRTGGSFPTIEEIFDPAIGKIEILGSVVLRHVEPGSLITAQYEWTLTLCRVIDNIPAC